MKDLSKEQSRGTATLTDESGTTPGPTLPPTSSACGWELGSPLISIPYPTGKPLTVGGARWHTTCSKQEG